MSTYVGKEFDMGELVLRSCRFENNLLLLLGIQLGVLGLEEHELIIWWEKLRARHCQSQ